MRDVSKKIQLSLLPVKNIEKVDIYSTFIIAYICIPILFWYSLKRLLEVPINIRQKKLIPVLDNIEKCCEEIFNNLSTDDSSEIFLKYKVPNYNLVEGSYYSGVKRWIEDFPHSSTFSSFYNTIADDYENTNNSISVNQKYISFHFFFFF
jgi:hypothetical protein